MKLGRAPIARIVVARPDPTAEQPPGMGLDTGDDDDEVRAILRAFSWTASIRRRGEDARSIAREAGVRARRWVVERSHRWRNRLMISGKLWSISIKNSNRNGVRRLYNCSLELQHCESMVF